MIYKCKHMFKKNPQKTTSPPSSKVSRQP
uniref:Uncharacterized protein n=1 Tax=Anguilla anguilla TaxID=7936 RepID=A0A0E9TGG5_ANGAN